MKGNMLFCESNKPLCKSKSSQTDCSPRRSRMKESREELYSFWCVSVGLTVSLSFVLSFLWPFFCSLSAQWCRRCTVKLKHWQKRKKVGGVGGRWRWISCVWVCVRSEEFGLFATPLLLFFLWQMGNVSCNIELNLCLIYRKYAKTELLC